MLNAMVLILLIGFNETILLLLLFMHLFLFIKAFLTPHSSKETKKISAVLFGVALIASLVVILAPGNGFRAAFFPGNNELLHSIVFSLLQTIRFFLDWVSNLPLLFASVLFVSLFSKMKAAFDAEMRDRNLKIRKANAKGDKEVQFSPLSEKPATLFVLDLTPDPAHWINTSYASFYGATKASLKK